MGNSDRNNSASVTQRSKCHPFCTTITNNGSLRRLFLQSHRTVMQPICKKSTDSHEEIDNKPLPFSKSKAASWSAKSSFSGKQTIDEEPWYQPIVISMSIGAILVWFCVLREENDLDRELDKSLYDRVEGMEEKQLQLTLEHNQTQGLNTKEVQDRLDEIRAGR